MISTIKFSEFLAAGNLNNNNTTAGLSAGTNAIFNNPWVFLPPGNTASRPIVPVVGQLRFNTDLLEYEYWTGAIWDQLTTNGNNTEIWQNITTPTEAMLPANAYMANNVGQVILTLPSVANFGTELKVASVTGSGGWKIAQNAAQYIIVDNTSTTVGALGFLQSANDCQSVSLVCMIPNIAWLAYSIVGNIDIG